MQGEPNYLNCKEDDCGKVLHSPLERESGICDICWYEDERRSRMSDEGS